MKKIIVLFLLFILIANCSLPTTISSFDIQYSFSYNYLQNTPNLIEIKVDLLLSNKNNNHIKVVFIFEGNELNGDYFGWGSPAIDLNSYETKNETLNFSIVARNNPAIIENLRIVRVRISE